MFTRSTRLNKSASQLADSEDMFVASRLKTWRCQSICRRTSFFTQRCFCWIFFRWDFLWTSVVLILLEQIYCIFFYHFRIKPTCAAARGECSCSTGAPSDSDLNREVFGKLLFQQRRQTILHGLLALASPCHSASALSWSTQSTAVRGKFG